MILLEKYLPWLVYKVKKFIPLIAILFFFLLFAWATVISNEKGWITVLKEAVVNGLPSMLVIMLVTLIIEMTVRKKERKEIDAKFKALQNHLGFGNFVSSYEKIPIVIERHLKPGDNGNCEINMVMIGADKRMLKDILSSIARRGYKTCSLKFSLLNPESEFAITRGNSINRSGYQEHIRSNLESMTSFLNEKKEFAGVNIVSSEIFLYEDHMPPTLSIMFDNEFVAFSPVWLHGNVKDGPFCFVPANNELFDQLSKADSNLQLIS